MIRQLPLFIGIAIAQAAGIAALVATEPGQDRVAAAAVLGAILLGALLAGAAVQGATHKTLGRVVDAIALGLAALGFYFFLQTRHGEILGWTLAGLQTAVSFRLRTRRDVLFDLLGSFGMLLFASAAVSGLAMLLLTMAFVAGSILALAAKYFLDQLQRCQLVGEDARPWRVTAPGALLFGLLPAFALAAPLILLLPVIDHHPLPFRIPEGGIIHAQPPPMPDGEGEGEGEGGGMVASIKGLLGSGNTGGKGAGGKDAGQAGQGQGKGKGGNSRPGPDPGKTPGETHDDNRDGQGGKKPGEQTGSDRKVGNQPVPGEEREGIFPGRKSEAKDETEKADLAGNTAGSRPEGDAGKKKQEPKKLLGEDEGTGDGAATNPEQRHPGGVCMPREPVPVPPKRDVCAFHVLNPYHHPGLYRSDLDPDSSTVMRVKSGAPVYMRSQVYDRYERGTWQCARGAVEVKPRSSFRYFFNDKKNQSVWNIEVAVDKQLSNMLPLALRPEFARYVAPSLSIGPDHAVSAPEPIKPGKTYYEESIIRVWGQRPTSDDNRLAANQNYLQVPHEVLDVVGERAAAAVRRTGRPLQVAEQLEGYLRWEHTHSLGKLALDGGAAEPLLDFLTGSRSGNAELFATALALMARSQGIPARVVVGHVAIRRPIDATDYAVHRLDAHAWTELYVSGHWTTFDATPIRDVPAFAAPGALSRWAHIQAYLGSLERLAGAFDEVVPDSGLPGTVWESASTAEERWLVRLWRGLRWLKAHWATLAGAFLLAGLLVWLGLRHREALRRLRLSLHLMEPRERVIETYAALERFAAGFGLPRRPSANHAAYLGGLAAVFPGASAPISRIGVEFGRARYGRSPVEESTAQQVGLAYDAATHGMEAARAAWIAAPPAAKPALAAAAAVKPVAARPASAPLKARPTYRRRHQ